MTPHPIQPLVKDEHGTVRFKPNAIVRFLLDAGPFDMNTLAKMDFSHEDRAQFAQLIGYSVSGWGELSYVSDEVYDRAAKQAHADDYDPNFGDDRICRCGHTYYRHFDTYEGMASIGCKYCLCEGFSLFIVATRPTEGGAG